MNSDDTRTIVLLLASMLAVQVAAARYATATTDADRATAKLALDRSIETAHDLMEHYV